jgi:hypothetical protein
MRRRRRWRAAALAGWAMGMPSIVTAPEVGGNRPTTMRPKVDFPEPDSPTSAKVSPRAMSNDTPSTAVRTCRPSPVSTRLSHGFETSNVRRRSRMLTKGRSAMPSPSRIGREQDHMST